MSANPWYTRVNAGALSDEARRLILEKVKKKLGFEKTLRALGIARVVSVIKVGWGCLGFIWAVVGFINPRA